MFTSHKEVVVDDRIIKVSFYNQTPPEEVSRRLEREVDDAPDLVPFIGEVRVVFLGSGLAYSNVWFRGEVWPGVSMPDVGTSQEPVPLAGIKFDATKWRAFFRDQMKEVVVRRLAEAARPLASASFMTDAEKIDAIRLAMISVEQQCGVMFPA